ncbi:MAG: division/cell wall cluster transcriptional repressor MraZ, partial [Gallicola sp.]|nr:division/cell wall cluster transcriptional repressor MraZ [Gallicola sp.]
EYIHTIDTKGRLIMPAKYRKDLGASFHITKGMDHCLFVYPEEEWKNFGEKILNLPVSVREGRAIQRLFYSGAMEAQLDKQGRVLLPPNLREYAGIDKEVILIGVATRIEIWDLERWSNYSTAEEMDYDLLMEKITDLDL